MILWTKNFETISMYYYDKHGSVKSWICHPDGKEVTFESVYESLEELRKSPYFKKCHVLFDSNDP